MLDYEFDMNHLRNASKIIDEKIEKTIDAGLLAELKNEIMDDYNHYTQNASKDQIKSAINSTKEEFSLSQTNQQYPSATTTPMENFKNHFKSVDKDGDKLLNKAEFREFFEILKNNPWKFYKGGYTDSRDRCDQYYDLYCQITPDVDGISLEDCHVFLLKVFYPTWVSQMIKDQSKKSTHKIFKIEHDSHLGKELLKKSQVKLQ